MYSDVINLKTPDQLDQMAASGKVHAGAMQVAVETARPGATTKEVDTAVEKYIRENGGIPTFKGFRGFPGSICISNNDMVVHGIPGARRITSGDIVKLDVTVETGGYIADAARSVVVKPASATAHNLVICARAAFHAALTVARAGVRVNEIGRAVEREVRRRGFSVIAGLSGHGVGRSIHEEPSVPNYYDPFQADVLTEGLVLTIEPIISAGSTQVVEDDDGWTLRTRDGSLSAHYEHTLVITRGSPVVLTAA